MTRLAVLVFWRLLALSSLMLGVVGVFVPLLPTVPFLLLAAWAAGKGWPALEDWLLQHPRHGPAIRRWRERRAVPRRAKWAAALTMSLSAALIMLSPAPLGLKFAVPLGLAVVGTWLWTRPET